MFIYDCKVEFQAPVHIYTLALKIHFTFYFTFKDLLTDGLAHVNVIKGVTILTCCYRFSEFHFV